MNYPSLSELEYFQEVALSKNISRAAERLGITQPSLSLALKRLEMILGVPLLIRIKSGVQLTQAGHQFLAETKNILLEWKRIQDKVKKNESELSGKYILGCHPSVGLYSFHHFIPELCKNFPNLIIDFQFDLSRKITEDIISFRIDFGLTINPVKHADLVLRKIATDQVGFWIKKGDLKKKQDTHHTLLCDQNLLQTQSLLKKIKTQKQFSRLLNISNLEIIASLTAQGVGVGILPSRVALNSMSSHPALELFQPKWPTFNDELYLVYRSDIQKSPASRTLADYIFQRLRNAFTLCA